MLGGDEPDQDAGVGRAWGGPESQDGGAAVPRMYWVDRIGLICEAMREWVIVRLHAPPRIARQWR